MPYCVLCGAQLREYVGLNGREGEGEWFCPKCDNYEAIPVEIDDDVTPPYGFAAWHPFVD